MTVLDWCDEGKRQRESKTWMKREAQHMISLLLEYWERDTYQASKRKGVIKQVLKRRFDVFLFFWRELDRSVPFRDVLLYLTFRCSAQWMDGWMDGYTEYTG